jgi:hypothetical protein
LISVPMYVYLSYKAGACGVWQVTKAQKIPNTWFTEMSQWHLCKVCLSCIYKTLESTSHTCVC